MESIQTRFILYLLILMCSLCGINAYKTTPEQILCSPTKHKILLGKGHESAAIVSITEQTLTSCNFSIEAPKHASGIYVVIQKLALRRGEGGICLDYLQLVTPKGSARRTCGEYQIGVTPLESFVISENIIYVHINLHSDPLLPGQSIEVSLVFTAYFNDCSRAGPNAKACIPERNEGCIFGRFWGDKFANCPSQDCIDEGGCDELGNYDDIHYIQPAPITLGAVTTVLLTLLLFMTCLWACRKHHICCWGPFCKDEHNPRIQDERRETSTVLPTAPPVIDIIHPPAFELHEPVEGGPVPGVTTPMAPNLDKDPPPSYESLFPD